MTHPLQIRLFGSPTIQIATAQSGAKPAHLGIGAQALLYYLASEAQPQSRTRLAGLLWGERNEDLARTSLRRTLSDLRKEIGDCLVSDYQSVTLNLATCSIDLGSFQAGVMQATTLDLANLQRALDHYQGDFLQGFFLRNAPDFENWLVSRRTYYRDLALSGWQTLANRYAQQGDLPQAISAARQLLSLEPWHEATHRSLMRWLAQTGQRGAALTQFEQCRRQLAEELDVEPSAETLALYEEIRTGRIDKETRRQEDKEHTVAPVLSLSPPLPVSLSPNLPPQPTPFVGRQQEVADVLQRLADPNCRLLTLIGPGGMGKTRLAIEAAKASYEIRNTRYEFGEATSPLATCYLQFFDGVFFVPLATVSTASGMVAALAEAVGFTFYNNVPAQQQLLGYLADKTALLVLDNFEHLLAGVDQLGEVLNAAPGIKLLVTSRELLNLQEEWLYPIGGLTLPPADIQEIQDVSELAEADAVRFFVQCAQRVRPGFDLSKEWRCVLRICRQVEGMPLGIELATSWLKALGCHEIASQIQRNLDFLSTRLHNVPARHRSMRAVFEYSWQLLTMEEQQVLSRLSVLHGFCQEGAANVAGASLFNLVALAEKSLIQVVRSEEHGRYVIHELLRQFAAEKLQANASEQALIEARHSSYYLTRLGEEASALNGIQQRAALTTLSEELENIRLAWLWAAQQGELATLAQALDKLYAFYTLSHRYQEGVELLEATLQALSQEITESADWLVRKVLNRLGGLYTNLGRYERAQTLLTAGLTLSQNLGLERESAFCLRGLGEIAGWQGNFALGKRHLDEALAFSRAAGDREGEAQSLARLCDFVLGLSDQQSYKVLIEQYLAVGRQLGNHRFVIHALRLLAFNSYTLGEYSATTTYCQEGLSLAEALDEHLELSVMLALYLCNSVAAGMLQPSEAKALSARAFTLVQEGGQPYYIAMVLYMLSQALCALHEVDLAEQYCQQGLLVARSANAAVLIVGSLAVLGDLYGQRREFHLSRRYLCEALQTGIATRIPLLTLEALVCFAAVLSSESKDAPSEEAIAKQLQAVKLLTLAVGEPACMQVFKDRANQILGELRVSLPVDAFSCAQTCAHQLTLEIAVAEILV